MRLVAILSMLAVALLATIGLKAQSSVDCSFLPCVYLPVISKPVPTPTPLPSPTPIPPTATFVPTATPTQFIPTATPTQFIPTATPTTAPNCDPSYPDVCIPPPPPDLDCGDITHRNFRVFEPDPHNFDTDNDGIGCEGQ